MKYFFSLLLLITLNTSLSYGANQPKDTAKTPQETTAEAMDAGKQNPTTEGTATVLLPPPAKDTAATPKTETAEAQSAQPATTEKRVPKGERALTEPLLHPRRPEGKVPFFTEKITQNKIMSLRETAIGQAILEGNIEAYVATLKELTEVFGYSHQSLLRKGQTEKDTLLDLMIETTKNREFFTNEMFHLLIFHVLIDISTFRSLSQTQLLLEKAKQVNNELAVKLLSGLETLIAKHENSYSTLETKNRGTLTELIRQKELKEQVIELVRNHYSKTNIALKAGFTALAGALTVWGYNLFTNASTDAVSFSYAPQISEFLSKVSDKNISIATMTIGAVLAAAGIQQCGKAFWRQRKVNNIRKKI